MCVAGWPRQPDKILFMRKLIAILLLSLMPLQACWATVSGYCQHERGAAARHLGHHEHQHHQKSAAHDQQAAASASADVDCGLCHAGGLVALLPELNLAAATPTLADLAAPVDLPSLSPPLERPERPNWS